MSLFTPSMPYDSNVMEAIVTNVDPLRFVCTVKTVRGQYFNEVSWLLPTGGAGKNGMHLAPSINDQVVVWTGLSYPIIVGSLPRLGTPNTSLTSTSGQELSIDAGNNTNIRGGFVTNPSKPADFVPGDQIMTTEGGAVLGALQNGSIIAKASALAMVLISKFDDLVRIVARNFERFSDVGQQTAANVKGRLYEFLGWDRSLARSKVGIYELQDVVGDVAAGEVLRGEPNGTTTLPGADTRLRKYWLTDPAGNSIMVEILYDNGKLDLVVQNADASINTREVQDKDKYEVTSTDPVHHSKVTIIPGSIVLDHMDGLSKVTIDGSSIVLNRNHGISVVTADDSAITVDHNGASRVVVNDASVTSTHGGATHIVDSSGVRSQFGTHFMTLNSTGIHIG
jgi:hypothetical protein